MFSDSINRVVVRKGVFTKEAKRRKGRRRAVRRRKEGESKEYIIQVRELVVESIVVFSSRQAQ